MKLALAFAAIVIVTSAQRPSNIPRAADDRNAETLRYDSEINPDGSFRTAVETNNGISSEAEGVPRDFGGNPPIVPVVIRGSFSWTAPDGTPIQISYVADENGYQATGDAIPTPLPIPEEILRSLALQAKLTKK